MGKKRHDLDFVKELLSQKKCVLLNDNYINNSTKMTIQDESGYLYFVNLMTIQTRGLDCFRIENPYRVENLKTFLLNEKILLSIVGQDPTGEFLKIKCLNEKCGVTFESTIKNIYRKRKCPHCLRQIPYENSLEFNSPYLASQWHPIKNGNITPRDVSFGSRKKVWWKCKEGHEWESTINARDKKGVCPYCSHDYPSQDYNLFLTNPEICKEWDYDKNKTTPNNFVSGSNKKVHWICEKSHEWEAKINQRVRGSGCPKCRCSKGEKKIDSFLKEKEITFIYEKTFSDLKGTKNRVLSYDFYLPEYNLLIEYQGEQHAIPISFHRKDDPFKEKISFCKKCGIN